MKTIIFDLEANGFLAGATKIHCVAYKELGEDTINLRSIDLEEVIDTLMDADVLIGHNIAGYDLPLIEKLYGKRYKGVVLDTLLLQCILEPEAGILSLENWAYRLKLEVTKVQHDDWSTYSADMGKRCATDVKINEKVYEYLERSPYFDVVSEGPMKLEADVARIHAIQTVHGVYFDTIKAKELLQELHSKISEIREDLVAQGPAECRIPGVPKIRQSVEKSSRKAKVDLVSFKNRGSSISRRTELESLDTSPFRKDGAYTALAIRYFEDNIGKVKGPYSKVSFHTFNPDSDPEVKEYLLSLGWRPTEYNRKLENGEWVTKSPKLTEDSYGSLPPGLGQKIAEYKTLCHRRNFLLNKDGKGAISNVRENGRVPAEAFTCGTPTSRYRHQGTVCNIPRVSTAYGPEFRSLFTVAMGHYLIGADLSGIEARMLAHYLLLGNYTKAKETADLIMTGDFHDANAKIWGVSRDTAKSILYALMYGAGPAKLGAIAGRNAREGKKMKQDFFKLHPGILELIQALESALDAKGYIKSMDGRPLFIRSRNKLLNTLLQNAATIVFKNWLVQNQWLIDFHDLDIFQVIAYHDECQYESYESKERSIAFGNSLERNAKAVGDKLKILVPIGAESKVGKTWRDTH